MAKTIFSKSPYHINISEANLVYTEVDIYVYTGVSATDRPATPNYVLKSTAINESSSFDIGSLVNDAIQYPADGTYRTDGAWLDYVIRYYTDNGSGPVLTTNPVVSLYAVDGYSYFHEGANFDAQKGLCLSTNVIYAPIGEAVKFPINKRMSTHSMIFKNGNTDNTAADLYTTYNGSSDSAEQFTYPSTRFTSTDMIRVGTVAGNLISDGTFSEGLSGITNNSGTAIRIDNRVLLTRGTVGIRNTAAIPLTGLTVGETYRLDLSVCDPSVTGFSLTAEELEIWFVGATDTDSLGVIWTDTDGYDQRFGNEFTVQDTSGDLDIRINGADGQQIMIDNVTIQQVDYNFLEEVKIYRFDECKYDPIKVKFVNRYGAMEDLWFFKTSKLKTEVESDTYQNNQLLSNGAYNTYDHQFRKYNIQAKETLTINSGFVVEEMNEAFVQLLMSSKVWITYEGREMPVNVKTTDIEHKTSLNDKLIQYTMDVDFAFNKINTIR